MLASDSAATKYAVASTAGGSRPALTSSWTGTGVRRARAANAGPIPSSVSTAGLDPMGEVAQLGKGVHHLGVGLRQELVDAVGTAVGEAHAGRPQGQADAQKALLGAVVQVALESTSLGVAGFDDAGREARTSTSWACSCAWRRSTSRSASAPMKSKSQHARDEDEQRATEFSTGLRPRLGRDTTSRVLTRQDRVERRRDHGWRPPDHEHDRHADDQDCGVASMVCTAGRPRRRAGSRGSPTARTGLAEHRAGARTSVRRKRMRRRAFVRFAERLPGTRQQAMSPVTIQTVPSITAPATPRGPPRPRSGRRGPAAGRGNRQDGRITRIGTRAAPVRSSLRTGQLGLQQSAARGGRGRRVGTPVSAAGHRRDDARLRAGPAPQSVRRPPKQATWPRSTPCIATVFLDNGTIMVFGLSFLVLARAIVVGHEYHGSAGCAS